MRRSAAPQDRVKTVHGPAATTRVRKKHRGGIRVRNGQRGEVTRNMTKQPGTIGKSTNASSTQWKIRAAAAITVASVAGFALAAGHGCDQPSTTSPQPPGGGKSYVLDYAVFESQVDPILTARGCDNLDCHGGGIRGTFELSPFDDKDLAFDFAQARLQVNGSDPAASSLLQKPLAEEAGGTAHGGGAAFASTGDPDYQALRAWIEAGEYR
jgi:hypothetical protein